MIHSTKSLRGEEKHVDREEGEQRVRECNCESGVRENERVKTREWGERKRESGGTKRVWGENERD